MSGVRVAAFSKYFAAGALCSIIVCGRHCAFMVASSSKAVRERCESVGRYADAVHSLEQFVEESGYSIRKLTVQHHEQQQQQLDPSAVTQGKKAEYVFP